MESGEFIKSSVENLVPTPSEFEDAFNGQKFNDDNLDQMVKLSSFERLLYALYIAPSEDLFDVVMLWTEIFILHLLSSFEDCDYLVEEIV
ncbi:hypothetical protein Tco_1369144 [Tanacetum coccineum]